MTTRPHALSDVEFPKDTIDLVDDLIPAIRQVLSKGLSLSFQRACVRIGQFERFSDGLKAPLVGGLRIDVHAAMKLGGSELANHALLMGLVNGIRKGTFPELLHLENLPGNRIFVITELLRKHVTVFDKVYREETTNRELSHIVTKVFAGLDAIHSLQPNRCNSSANLPTNPEPFMERIRGRLAAVLKIDPELAVVMEQKGVVLGSPCPPISRLLRKASQLAVRNSRKINPTLIHGDPHLANIMVRRHGRYNYRVRLIDPNPDIGFSQPLYDVGKLLHWAAPVGWAKATPSRCGTVFRWVPSQQYWSLANRVPIVSAAAERRRQFIERAILRHAQQYAPPYGADFSSMLSLSLASAHIGMAALLAHPGEKHPRRFVFAHALRQLVRVGEVER